MLILRTITRLARQLYCLACAASMTFSFCAWEALAQSNFEENAVLVKLTEAAANQIDIRIVNNVVETGLVSLDALHQEHRARAMNRVLRDAGRFEARHAQYGLTRYYKVSFDAGADIHGLVQAYAADANVESAQPNWRHQLFGDRPKPTRPNFTPNDPLFSSQWHYHNTGQTGGTPDADIDAPEAWDIETGDPAVIVSDLDTGQDLDHPDLAANLWINAGEIPGNGIDDDGNGYIDDVNGWDFSDDDSNPDDYDDHGTHTAGTVAAVTNNGVGVAGVAHTSKVMACKIFPNAFDDVIAEAFTYAADNGSIVSTNSWGGGGQSNLIEDAIDYYLATTDGVVVFAAGNSNSSNPDIGYPASYPPVMAVAATDHMDHKASFSNYGDWVDVSAPGVNVLSTIRFGAYASFNGTSMACPHVAGVAALVFAANPGMTGAQVRAQIEASTDNIDALNPGFAGLLGTGRVNAHKALTGGPFPNPPANLQASVSGNNVQLSWIDPTTNTDGSPINLQHLNVYRGGVEIAQVGPGVQTYLDAGLADGLHVYNVTATNAEGEESGPSNDASAIVGDIDVVIWKHPEVSDPNVEEKARARGLTVEQVRELLHTPASHLALEAALEANGKSVVVVDDITTINLFDFEALFAVVGIFPNNHVIPANGAEALAIENYILGGGKVYMEGGDMWQYDPQFGGHDFAPLFGLDGIADGGADLSTVLGVNGTFTQGMNFTYSGQESFIDRLIAVGDGFVVHTNQSPAYNCGVARVNAGTAARTVGTSFEFGGLNDNSASVFTKANLMAQYLNHFNIVAGINADFAGNPTSGFVPLSVVFTNLSTGTIDTWSWTFPGGNPASATGPGPHTVLYNNAGTFDVSLTVSGPEGSNTETKSGYITALIPPDIAVNPQSFSVILPLGGTVGTTLTISNSGGSDLNFSIGEAAGTAFADALRIKPDMTAGAAANVVAAHFASEKFSSAGSTDYNAGHAPIRDAYLPPPAGSILPSATSVLLLYMGGDPAEIQAALAAYPDLAPVDTWNLGANGIPTLPQLQAYKAVVLMNNNAFPDAIGLGNVLADYVDAGGGVTTTLASFASGFALAGRFMDQGYSPFEVGVGPVGGSNLGAFDPGHPIMAGVTAMFGDLLGDVPLAAGASLVASWATGLHCVAVKNTVVAFNIFVASPGFWTGDVPLVLHNAILFSSGGAVPWLDENPKSGTVAAGGNATIIVSFDATELTPGDYYANLVISSNDPDESELLVPVHLQVVADAVIWIPSDVLEPNLAVKAQQRGLSLQDVEALAVKPTSHLELKAALEANGKSVHVVSDLTSGVLANADYLFVVAGIFPNNHVIKTSDAEPAVIENFLAGGGKVYIEGGDVWYYDPQFLGGYNFGGSFYINPLADGADDLKSIFGACAAAGRHFTYSGQNNFIDRLAPVGPACTIHANSTPAYDCGIAYDSQTGARTIGNAFEFGGLDDASLSGSTKQTLMAAYLDFFDNGTALASATFNFPLQGGGWYLISLPVTPDNAALSNLFPSALAAFAWDFASQSYTPASELLPKQAYWLALPSATTVTIYGQPLLSYEKTYTAPGWDMIGSVMETSGLHAEPNTNVFAMFGYDAAGGSYFSVRAFEPNHGYWLGVMADANNPLHITVGATGSATTLAANSSTVAKRFGSLPPSPPPFTIAGSELIAMPTEYGLSQNYPNPFNPETVIEYQLPEAGKVSLKIYTILGREVRALVSGEMPAGVHRVHWDGKDATGQQLDSGVYLYRLQTRDFAQTRKVVLVR